MAEQETCGLDLLHEKHWFIDAETKKTGFCDGYGDIAPDGYRTVVTRYGARRHYARRFAGSLFHDGDRHFTLCHGVSAWTIREWARLNDHPDGLTIAEMQDLLVCERCRQVADRNG